jgi:extracellular sulfatase Sulf
MRPHLVFDLVLEYDGSYQPVGWHQWMGLVKNSRFYNYTINFNGEKIKHGFDYHRDYFTDLITNDSLAFIETHMRSHADQPFLLVLSYPAPHGPEDPAPQYADMFANVETHRFVYDSKKWTHRDTN